MTRMIRGWMLASMLFGFAAWTLGCPEEVDDDDAGDDDAGDDDDTGDDDTGDDDTGDDDTAFEIDPQRIFDDVEWLADDARTGRLPGTQGNEDALDYVEAVIDDLGLIPSGDGIGGQSFRQPFPLEQWTQLSAAEVTLGKTTLTEGTDYLVWDGSGSGDVTGNLVFVGYGMTVPPFDKASYPNCPLDPAGYDDYAGVDVKGKTVLMLRHGPDDDEDIYDHCPANAVLPQTEEVLWTFRYKAANAASHGATGLILVQHYGPPSEVIQAGMDYDADLSAVMVDRDLMDTHLPDLHGWADAIDASLAPASQETALSVTLVTDTQMSTEDVDNLIGVLEGTDPTLGSEVIVVGAHIDHIGTSGQEIYNGADDNASGSAALMELARLATTLQDPARTVVFAWWNAEEIGLIGSCYYAYEDPIYTMNETVLAISIDMVGAGDGSGLNLFGGNSPTNSWFADLMEAAVADAGLDYDVNRLDQSMNSDHACFAMQGVPAMLALSLGPHPTYHTPQDTIDGILIDDLEASTLMLWASLEPMIMGTEDDFLSVPPPAAPPAARPATDFDVRRLERTR